MATDPQHPQSETELPSLPPRDGQLTAAPPLPGSNASASDLVATAAAQPGARHDEASPHNGTGSAGDASGVDGVQLRDEQAQRRGEGGGQVLTGRAARTLPAPTGVSLSPMRLAWRQLRKNRFAVAGGLLLIALYSIAILAPFIAPYDAQDQTPGGVSTSYHPPMKLRFRDQAGNFHLRPFVYGTVTQFNEFQEAVYLPDPNQMHPVRFFAEGAPYTLLGFIPMRHHLIGVGGSPGNGQGVGQSAGANTRQNTGPGAAIFLLGTDEAGRDYFSRLLLASQISLSVGLIAIAITFTLGLLIGGISGFYGGRVDDVIMRVCEVIMSVPEFYLLLALAAALPPTLPPVRTYVLIISILAFVGWAGMARIVRGMVLSVREREYVEAARALGVSDLKIIVRHILPATFTYAIVAATMSIPGYILGEAGLSFLGLGIRDPVPSWGNMLSAAQNLTTLETRPWILVPGFMIFITTLAFNFLGDGLRDAFDPKSRRLG